MIKKDHERFVLTTIITQGLILRLSFLLGNSFPLGDGGFFFVMVKDLISNNYNLPYFSTYNHANIPFIYPPLGFYFAGIINTTTRLDLLQVFRFVPLLFAVLSIPAFYCLAVEITKDKWVSLISTTVFTLLPMEYSWLIMGGGITRAVGSFFTILALTFVFRFIDSGKWRMGILSILFCGFTVLSHPEWSWFLFYSIGFFCIFKILTKTKKVIIRATILLTGTVILVSPWLITVLHRHNFAVLMPLLDSGFSRWEDILRFILLSWSGETLFPIFTLFALVGIIVLINKKYWFLPIWFVLVYIMQGRAADQKVVIPLSFLAGIGGKALYNFAIDHIISTNRKKLLVSIIGCIYIYSLIGSSFAVNPLAKSISKEFLQGIEWFGKETPVDSTFLVITENFWANDNYSEWVSALTDRISVSVVQGYEWAPGFSDRIYQYQISQNKYSEGITALNKWINKNQIHVDYIIFPKGNYIYTEYLTTLTPCQLKDVLLLSGNQVVFENTGVLIIKR